MNVPLTDFIISDNLGACVLLPWNTEIVAGSYIRARLEGSKMEASFSSWVALTFTTGNLVFLWMANRTQQGVSTLSQLLCIVSTVTDTTP